MYRGTERSKITDLKEEWKRRENVNLSPLRGQNEINIKIFNKEERKIIEKEEEMENMDDKKINNND